MKRLSGGGAVAAHGPDPQRFTVIAKGDFHIAQGAAAAKKLALHEVRDADETGDENVGRICIN